MRLEPAYSPDPNATAAGRMIASVSVIIPAYNAARTIARSLQSSLDQSVPPLEVLVIDDGSTDRTAEIVAGFGSPVRLIRQSRAGPAAARNAAARQAAGTWLALLDADDWWMPNKLERQLLLARHCAAGIIHTLANVSAPGIPDRITFDDLWQRNLIVNSSVLIRRATFDALGGFIEHADLRVCEDYNLWLRAAAEGVDIRLCRELLTYYRPGAGISSNVADFLRGAECNISLIAARYGIDPQKVEQKRTRTMLEIGRMALGHRDLPLARSLLSGAFARNPHPFALVGTAAAHLPRGALDLARRWRDDGQGAARRMNDHPISLFTRASGASMTLPGNRPALLVIIDTEMETGCTPLPPPTRGVTAMRHLEGLQRILRRHGVVPTYAVNYAVACSPEACAPLRDLLADGRCDIGSQLHAWINPPFDDSADAATIRGGDLPAYLEYDKIAVLTRRIEDSFCLRPILFRGGRHGAGAYTARILKHFGYRIDCTVLPLFDPRQPSGPDDRWVPAQPTWCDPERELLEIPATVGMTGALRWWGGQLYPLIKTPLARRLGAPAFFRRLRLLDRCRLSPEDTTLPVLKRLSRELVQHDRGRVLVLSFHCASLQPGSTPLVRTAHDRDRLLDRIDRFLAFFVHELNGFATTPAGLLALASVTSRADRPEGPVGTGSDAKTYRVRRAVPLSDRSSPPQQVRPVAQSKVDLP